MPRFLLIAVLLAVTTLCQNLRESSAAGVARMSVYESPLKMREIILRTVIKLQGALEADGLPNLAERLEESAGELRQLLGMTEDTIGFDVNDLELYIDGQQQERNRDNLRLAAKRWSEYARSETGTLPGSVEMRFKYTLNGVRVLRSNWIADNHVRVVTDLDGSFPRVDSIRLEFRVDNIPGGGTRFTTIAGVHAPIGHFARGPITRLAERIMTQQIDEKLGQAHREMQRLTAEHEGSIVQPVQALIHTFRNGLAN